MIKINIVVIYVTNLHLVYIVCCEQNGRSHWKSLTSDYPLSEL